MGSSARTTRTRFALRRAAAGVPAGSGVGASVQNGDLDDDDNEPPVPSGLKNLTGPLQAIGDFLGIDNELIEATAEVSGEEEPGPTRDDLAAWIRQIPESEKDALLLNVAINNTLNLQAELLRRYAHRRPTPKAARASKPARRTVGQLLATARELEEQSSRFAAERKAAEKARQAQQEMERRANYLDQLAKRQQTVWHQVAELDPDQTSERLRAQSPS
jgi:hypothetical protein